MNNRLSLAVLVLGVFVVMCVFQAGKQFIIIFIVSFINEHFNTNKNTQKSLLFGFV
jgi:hypothetical protein